jgi:hypothetical protein
VCSNQPGLQHYNKPSKTQVIKDFQTLHDIAALCKSNGAQLILNINPELGKSFRLAPIYRSFKVITAPDFHNPSYFYDTHHMTCEGANQYSQGLKKRLVKLLEK